ncbi:hypothetical protein BGZ65_000847 [Modicella reniformis]|uniref:Uncharacterized protein n=1 Tax=Modicella reniformis TaxID=1440133 RepID=A0A9P6MJ82_9FUNG|nr:hypothetical protein BGZ65_000847 [Modicella reniformis]
MTLTAGQSQVSSVTLATAPTSSVRTFIHTSQLPPVPPLQLQHNHQLQPSRNVFQGHSQSLGNSQAGSQHNQFGLTHLSDLMTGNLMVSKSSAGLHPGSSNSKPPPLASSPNHPMFHGQNTFMPLQHPQSASSHSEDPFVYDQSSVPLYSTQQDQQQQQRHDAYVMSRGASSSSTCSTSSSTTPQQEHLQLNGPNSMKGSEFTGVSMLGSTASKAEFDQTSGITQAVKSDPDQEGEDKDPG